MRVEVRALLDPRERQDLNRNWDEKERGREREQGCMRAMALRPRRFIRTVHHGAPLAHGSFRGAHN